MNFIDTRFLASIAAPCILLLASAALFITFLRAGRPRYLRLITIAGVLASLAMLNQVFEGPSSPAVTNMLYIAAMGIGLIGIIVQTGRQVNYPLAVLAFAAISLQLWYFEAMTPLPHARIAITNFGGAVLLLAAALLTYPQRKTSKAANLLYWSILLMGLHLLPRGVIFVTVSLSTQFEFLLHSPVWIALQLSTALFAALFLFALIWTVRSGPNPASITTQQ